MTKHHLWKLIAAIALAVTLVAPGASAATSVFQSPPPTPPPNDNFDFAEQISTLPFNGSADMTWATTQSNEPQYCSGASQTVWYRFTPSVDGAYKIDLSGFYDANLVLYQSYGSGMGNLNFLNCMTYGAPSINFNGHAGNTYYIQVGKLYGGAGTAFLSLQQVVPPSNDNFANATVILALPFNHNVDTTAASTEAGEPTPSCAYGGPNGTVWYAFTPTTSGSVSANINSSFSPVLGVYTGNSLAGLTEVGCHSYGGLLTFHVDAGTTYYFQASSLYGGGGSLQFQLVVAPLPVVSFYFYPSDPSMFDTINFYDSSYDPAGLGIQSQVWKFGDGATATGCCVTHRYASDADYTVKLKITTFDSRTASLTQVVHVKTHDVAITKFTVPASHRVGKTAQIVVGINNRRYTDDVQVQLFKSTPSGFQWVGTLQQTVPVRPRNKTTDFLFSYTFTMDDLAMGKVTFKAVATIMNLRDALPADNEAIAPPTKVKP